MKCLLLLFLLGILEINSDDVKPKVIIIGAGPSGIAAASKLMENGINDVTILEAENRYGGRIKKTRIGEYWADLGGQWVHGEIGNVAFGLASPLGLLSKSLRANESEPPNYDIMFFESSGNKLLKEAAGDISDYINEVMRNITEVDDLKTGSLGEYLTTRINNWFGKHSEIDSILHKPLMHSIELVTMAVHGAEDWNDVSAIGVKNAPPCPGYSDLNWKERTYGTILDILMKRYPNSEDELPVLNRTLLNKKVLKINYGEEGPVRVTTADGNEYTADHVIFTASLGVLKADHEKIFEPHLPEKNKNAIERLGMGKSAKILMYYENPWWESQGDYFIHTFLWTEEDRKTLENDTEKGWMLGLTYGFMIEWKPKLYMIWLSGPHLEQMEKIPEELFKNQTLEILQRFFGKTHNITEPTEIQRSLWNTNENFRGSYSYPTVQSVTSKSGPEELGAPVMRDIPIIQFAGEATEPRYFSMVHGAISSGWREADRLINLYPKKSAEH